MGAYLRGWLHWLTQRLKLIFSWILSSIRRTISKYLHWDRTTRNYNLLDFSWLWYLCKTLCTCALIDCFMISGEHQFSWTGLKFRVSTIILLCKIVLLIIQFYVLTTLVLVRAEPVVLNPRCFWMVKLLYHDKLGWYFNLLDKH